MLFLKSKNIIILGIVAFLIMNFWSLYSMPMDGNGRMVNCPFMNGFTNFCQMSLSEHINQWQQMFTAVKEKSMFLESLSFLIFIFVSASIINRISHKLKYQPFRNYLYRYAPEIKLFNNLAIAFSDGIIHSKIYA